MNKTNLTTKILLAIGAWGFFHINLPGCSESNRHYPDVDQEPSLEMSIGDDDPFALKDDSMKVPHRLSEDMTKPARIGLAEEV